MKKIRVVTIDDSAFIRKALRRILSSDPAIEVVGEAGDGKRGIELIKELKPDVVTLDYKMPGMDGLETLKEILKIRKIPVIMISSFTREGGEITLKALEAGAVDFIDKTSVQSPIEFVKLAQEITDKIKAATRANLQQLVARRIEKEKQEKLPKAPLEEELYSFQKIIIIGASTGGPQALQYLIPSLPFGYPFPVVVVQHIPRLFSRSLAERLDSFSKVHVVETEDGMKIARGKVYIAKAGVHLYFTRKEGLYILTHSSIPENSLHKPSIDITMTSAAKVFGKNAVGILLTGMGKDGAAGLLEIKKHKGMTVAESKETAIIYGMPKAAVEIGAVQKTLPLPLIKDFLLKLADESSADN